MSIHKLTVDLEDWYHCYPVDDWPSKQSRVERLTVWLLDTLEKYDINATFFILGYTADRHPKIIKEIYERGHEIGIHGYDHKPVKFKSTNEFRDDINQSIDSVASVVGSRPWMYRAPEFSIDIRSPESWEVLADCGITHDSSIYRGIVHKGSNIPDVPFRLVLPSGRSIIEYPLYPRRLFGLSIPYSGGGYFRILPFWLTLNSFIASKTESIFYIHPRDLDPNMHSISGQSIITNIKIKIGVSKSRNRFDRLLKSVEFSPLVSGTDISNIDSMKLEEL